MNTRNVCAQPGSCLLDGLPASTVIFFIVAAVVLILGGFAYLFVRGPHQDQKTPAEAHTQEPVRKTLAWREPRRSEPDGLAPDESLGETVRKEWDR